MIDSGCKGFCVYPHGMRSALATIFALISLGLSIGATASCSFVKSTDRLSTGFGMWSRENTVRTAFDNYRCVEYAYTETRLFDTKWNAASGLAYAAGSTGFIFTVLLVGTSCAGFRHPIFFRVSAAFFVLAGILSLSSLVGLNSTICESLTLGTDVGGANECTPSTGAWLAVAAGVCYFITAAVVLIIPPADDRKYGNNDEDNVLRTAKISPKNDDTDSEEKDNAEEAVPREEGARRGFCLTFWSNILFLNGSTFFMWLAVLDLQWIKSIQDIANAIAGDELLWWRDYMDDGYQYDDDYVFQTRFHWVSKYQIIYFVAAASFMVQGFLDFFGTPGVRGLFFVFAGTFGLIAAWSEERDPENALVFSLISAHMFVIEAIGLVVHRGEYSGNTKRWIRMNDICFVTATSIDLALSYTSIFKYNVSLAKADVSAAALWLFCAVFYVGATLIAKRHGHFDQKEPIESKKEDKNGDVEQSLEEICDSLSEWK